MTIPLRLLIAMDSEDNALLAMRELQRAGYNPAWDRVASAKAFAEKLDEGHWELIISDYGMPGFDGLEALAMARKKDPDLPVILLSRGIGEEAAVEAIKAGASDCILTDRLDRLPAAVGRALRDSELLRSRRAAEAGLREKTAFYSDLVEKARDGIVVTDLNARIKSCNKAFLDIIGIEGIEDAVGLSLMDITPPEYHERELGLVREQAYTRGCTDNFEKEYIRPDGRRTPVSVRIRLRRDAEGKPYEALGLARDISEEKSARQAFEESARLYRLLTENANDVIWSCNLDMAFQYVSPSIEKLLGWTPEEVIEAGVTMTLPPESLRLAAGKLQAVLDQHRSGRRVFEPVMFEIEQNRKDGTRVWTELSASPFFDDDGRMAGISGVTRDISERKKAENALLRSKQEWERTFDSVPDLIAILDDRHRILRANRAMAERLGLTPGQCIGRTCCESIHGGKEPIASCPHTLSLADGRVHTAEVHEDRLGGDFLVSCTPLLDEQGARIGSVHVARDITERKCAQEALRQSEEKFRGIFENTLVGIFQSTPEGRYITVNPACARMFGYASPEEMITSVTDIGRQLYWDSEERRRCIETLKSSGTLERFEVKCRKKDSSPIWTVINSRVVRDEAGNLFLIEGVIDNITSRKRAEEALRESERFNSAIISGASEGIVVYDTDLRYVVWNRFMENLTGMKSEDVLGHRATDLFPHIREQGIEQIMNRALRGETVSSEDIPFHAPQTGKTGWVQSTFSPHVNARGDVVGVIAMIRDMTERKTIEASLRQSEERFSKAFRSSPVMEAITDLNDGRIVDVNNKWLEALGYTREEVIGRSTTDIGVWADPQERRNILLQLKENKRFRDVHVHTRTKSGEIRDIYMSGELVRAGSDDFFLSLARDVTDTLKAEKALRESESRFRLLVENAPDGIYVQTQGCIVYVNDTALRMFGARSTEELLGRPFMERIHPDFRDRVRERARIVNEEKRTVAAQEQIYLKLDGTPMEVEVSVVPIRYEGHDGALVFIRDISERKRAEKALRESESRFGMLIENAPDGIFVQTQGRFSYLNEAALHLFGAQSPDELIGQPLLERIHTDFHDHVKERSRLLREEKKSVPCQDQVYLKLDGTPFDVSVGAIPIRFEGHDGALAFVRDITERKEAEKRLEEQVLFMDALMEAIPSPIFFKDIEGRYLGGNSAFGAFMGSKRENFVGKTVHELSPTDLARKYHEMDLELIRKGEVQVYESQVNHADGTRHEVIFNKAVYRGADGQTAGLIGVILDITDRKLAEEKLQEAHNRLDQIIEYLPDATFVIDADRNVIAWNRAIEQMTGISKAQMIGKGNYEYALPFYGERRPIIIDLAFLPDEEFEKRKYDAIHRFADALYGEVYVPITYGGVGAYLSATASRLRDASGNVIGAIETIRDITGQKKAEQALKESLAKREELEAIISKSPIVVVLYRMEKDYPIEYASESIAQYGYRPEDFTSGRIGILDIIHPDDVDKVVEEAQMHLRMGCDDITQDYRVRTAWGDYQWVLNRTRMRRDSNGLVTHGQAIIYDITDRKRAEISLRESGRQMRALLDNIPDIVWLKDRESRYIAANEPFGRSCGSKPEELVGKTDLDLWPKDLAETYLADDREVIQSGRAKRVEEFLEDVTGKRIWIETFKTPIRNDQGDVIGTTGIARDITERKSVEDLYRMLSDKSLAGVYVVQEGVFKYINANAASYAGYTAAELVGRRSTFLVHPEDGHIARKYSSEMLRGIRQTPYEFRIIDKAGRVRWILETVTTIPYEGNPAILGNSMDITQLKEAQQKLEELQALESSILSAIPLAVVGLENHRIIFANDNVETVFGWKPAEIIGGDLAVFFSSEAACDTVIRRIATALQNGKVYSLEPEHPLVHRDGRAQDCRVTAARIGNGSGESLVATFEDITDRKRAQLQILQSEKMASIGQLAAGVAHEINNPTGYVSSNLKTLSEYFEDVMGVMLRYRALLSGVRELVEKAKLDGNLAGLVGDIEAMEQKVDIDYILKDAPSLIHESREGTERIKEIVLSLKNFAHPGEVRFSYSDVHKNLDSTLNVVWNELKYKTTVRKEYGELPEIECYPQQINQVFMNMLVNAAQAIQVKGEIEIRTRSLGDVVEISISDTGVGIPEENLARIFDPFFTTKEVGKGTGLGLNVAYNIVKKHRGAIDVKSKIGEGTTFTIRLPVHQAEAMA